MQNVVHFYQTTDVVARPGNSKVKDYLECKPVLLEYTFVAGDLGQGAGRVRDNASPGIRGLKIFSTDAVIVTFGTLQFFKAPVANAQVNTAMNYVMQNTANVNANAPQYTLILDEAKKNLYLLDAANASAFAANDTILLEIILKINSL